MAEARELYEKTVRNLPVTERLRLASFILNDIAPALTHFDLRKDWTDEETSDLASFLMEHAGRYIPLDDAKDSAPPTDKH